MKTIHVKNSIFYLKFFFKFIDNYFVVGKEQFSVSDCLFLN